MFVGHAAVALAARSVRRGVARGGGGRQPEDLPLWPGRSPLFGFGLWNSFAATYLVEGAVYVLGCALYLRATRARDLVGSLALWAFLLVPGVIWAAMPFGPPPPSVPALALVSLGVWLLIVWGAWADAHREPRETAP